MQTEMLEVTRGDLCAGCLDEGRVRAVAFRPGVEYEEDENRVWERVGGEAR